MPSALATASGAECQNSGLRTGYSAYLPDCRAYEFVSPPGIEPYFETTGLTGNITEPSDRSRGGAWGVEASTSGDRLGFFSTFAPSTSASGGGYYLSTRGPDGWSTATSIPPQSADNSGRTCFNAYPATYSPDLSTEVLADGQSQGEDSNEDCGADEPPLVANEPRGFQNLFLHASGSASYRLINVTPSSITPNDAWFQAASADLSHVFFTEAAELTPEAPAGEEDLYEWSDGAVRLVTILPNGTATQGSLADADLPSAGAGPGAEMVTHSVSADGSRVEFVANGNLYMRERADREQSPRNVDGTCIDLTKACTVQIDASQGGGLGGGGTFQWASADGTLVFFTDDASAGLTVDTVPNSGQNLYQYDATTGKLTDLTPDAQAEVQGVSGVGESGAYVYFVAEGALSPSPNSVGEHATAGQPNLYLAHGDAGLTFVATLSPSDDSLDWRYPPHLTARTSPSGVFFAFNSVQSFTGYDNVDVVTGEPDQEIFLYSAADNQLSCASCDPRGIAPSGPARIVKPVSELYFLSLPGHQQRNVSEDGQVFFDTVDSLTSRDSNGTSDVYEYENKELHLLSAGTASVPSYFYEASADGNNVFLFTSQQLVPQDLGADISVYDARVEGGAPEESAAPLCEDVATCRGPSSGPPDLPTVTTLASDGPDDAKPAFTLSRKVEVTSKSTRGRMVRLRVKVLAPGRMTVFGAGLRTAHKTVSKPGEYVLRIALTTTGRRKLKHKGKLRIEVHITYKVVDGPSAATLTFATVTRR